MPPAYLRSPLPTGHFHENGCTGKIGFVSRAEAKIACKRILNRLYFYRCQHCQLWHVSQSRRKYFRPKEPS